MIRVLLVCVVVLLGGCKPRKGEVVDGGAPADAPRSDAGAAERSFALGIEYTEKGLAAPFGAAGIRWAKTRLEAFSWGAVQKAPAPAGGAPSYDWSCTDALVAEYQNAGMSLVSYLSPQSDWASVSTRDAFYKLEHLSAYRAWVHALIERYDGDGRDDAPGLRAPIRHWVVGGEWTGFWGSGNVDDYIAFFQATRAEARDAFPDVQLGAIPFMMFDVFAGHPSDAEIAARLKDPPPPWRNSTAGMMKILDHPELYEFVDVHSLGDQTEIAPTLRWLKGEMSRRGYQRPIWIDDAFPIGYLATGRAVTGLGWPPVYPVAADQERAVYDLLVAIAKNEEPLASRARPWLEAEVAKGVVKKALRALSEGAAGIQIGNTEDWFAHDTIGALRHSTVTLIGAAAAMGLLDVTHEGLKPCDVRRPGAARPGLRAARLLVEMLGPEMDVEPLEIPPPPPGDSVVQLGFRRGNRLIIVAWTEPPRQLLPGDPDPPVLSHTHLPAGPNGYRFTTLPTARGAEPLVTMEPGSGATLIFSVTSVPVFIEAAP
jgi:hypothetical protein